MKETFLTQKIASQITRGYSQMQTKRCLRKVTFRYTRALWDFLSSMLIWEPVEKPSFDNNVCVINSSCDLPNLLNQGGYLRSRSCKVVLAKVRIVQNLKVKMQFYLLKSKLTVRSMNVQKHPSLKKTSGVYVGLLCNSWNNWSK